MEAPQLNLSPKQAKSLNLVTATVSTSPTGTSTSVANAALDTTPSSTPTSVPSGISPVALGAGLGIPLLLFLTALGLFLWQLQKNKKLRHEIATLESRKTASPDYYTPGHHLRSDIGSMSKIPLRPHSDDVAPRYPSPPVPPKPQQKRKQSRHELDAGSPGVQHVAFEVPARVRGDPKIGVWP
ncbi:MAG: hypothetical protein ACRYGG_23560 [Janthinobacterium lividum]